jgi:hypothetical protein
VVVGAPFDGTGSSQTGSVFVYKEVAANTWELFGDKITPVDGLVGDSFGFSVDIDEDATIVIGSRVRLSERSVFTFIHLPNCSCIYAYGSFFFVL